MPGSAPAVEVTDLTVSFAGAPVAVVKDVSFTIPQAGVMGLVGESGCGKSTVALALLAYARRGLRITSGSVRIGSTEMLALRGAELREVRGRLVSYVPQDPASSLNPAHRVGPQLREALLVHRNRLDAGVREPEGIESRVREILDEVRLPATDALLRSYPHQLSGGQQQRVAIAMAVACRPRLLVLDEPTTGLDVTTQRHVLETVTALTKNYGIAALYVSHDLPVVGQVADTTAVMYAGRIVEQGSTARLFAAPRHPYTAGLWNAAPSADHSVALVGIEGHPPAPGSWPNGCAFVDRCARRAPDCAIALPPLAFFDDDRAVRCIHPLAGDAEESLGAARTRAPLHHEQLALRVEGLVAEYLRGDVLHGVDFDLERGSCTAIVGESGAGKTTLARCLVGLHTRWHGSISLDGVELHTDPRQRTDEQRRRLQYVFQNPYGSLNPTLTVAENIEEPLRHFERHLSGSARRQRALDILATVALNEGFANRLPAALSGGERQRVAIARALVVNPEILVCDEITSALDVSVQAVLVEQLRELQLERELSMVFITHNIALVRSIAQNVVVLENGVVVEEGPAERVLDEPRHPYTQQLLRDLPRASRAPAA